MGNLFLKFLTVAAVMTAPLAALLFPLRPWMERRYAPQTRRSLWRWMRWLLVLFGSLMAGMLALPQTTFTIPDRLVSVPTVQMEVPSPFPDPVPVAPDGAEAPPIQTPAATEPPADDGGRPVERRLVPLTTIAGGVWASVAAALFLIQYFRYFRAKWRLRKASAPTEDFNELRDEVYAQAEIRRLPGLDCPMTMGTIYGPVVFLPEGDVAPLAVRHELTHLRQGDLDERHMLFWACALYWFDPLVWYMAHVAEWDMEAACDAQVTAGMSPAEKRAYGELLLSAAGGRAAPLSTRFSGGKARMKARLAQLFRPGKSGKVMVAAVTLLGVLAVGLVACETAETPMFSGTVYANVRYDEVGLDEEGRIDSAPLELVDCVGGLVGDGYKTATYPLPDTVTLDGRTAPREGWEEKELYSFLTRPIISSLYTPGRTVLKVEMQNGEIAAMEWLEGQTYVGGMLWRDESHNTPAPYVLRLPSSMREAAEMRESSMVTDSEGRLTRSEAVFYQKGVTGPEGLLVTIRGMDEAEFWAKYPAVAVNDALGLIIPLGTGGGLMFYAEYPDYLYADRPEEYNLLSTELHDSLGPEDFCYLGAESYGLEAYTNETYGFSLTLPESWHRRYTARDIGG